MRYLRMIAVFLPLIMGLTACQLGTSTPHTPIDPGPETIPPGTATESLPTDPLHPLLTPEATEMDSAMTPSVAAPASTIEDTDDWTKYQNIEAGYSIEYPADWTLKESTGASGELITTFAAPNDLQGIIVGVLPGELVPDPNLDMPNIRCQQVSISGLSGQRCFDTVAFSISTTLVSQEKQYSIATFGKHPNETIYERFLESFTVTS